MNYKIGVFLTCFDETEAVEFALTKINEVYPNINIYLVSDGGKDFSYLKEKYTNLQTEFGENSMGEVLKLTHTHFQDKHQQDNIKKAVLTLIERLRRAIDFCGTEYILMADPDVYLRSELTIPSGVKLLGSRVNTGLPDELKKILSEIPGALIINSWGATPGIFEVSSFIKGVKILLETNQLLDKLCMSFYAMFAHDVILPVIFSLIGEEETFNPDIVECYRNPNWEQTDKPLVHQFKKYYKNKT